MKTMRVFIFLVLSLLLVNCGKEEKKLKKTMLKRLKLLLQTMKIKKKI